MIQEIRGGNLLNAEAEALVNAVNAVGVMGKGLALAFRRKFSADYFEDYKRACRSGDLKIGKVHFYTLNSNGEPRFIVNFPTKNHWREKSRIEDIESGLQSLLEEIEKRSARSIAVPALGCGLGGLDWKNVRPLIEKTFAGKTDIKVFLFLPENV